jgi:hypothetical protein
MQRQNLTQWCEDILQKEDRQMLLTQQTGPDRIGDCFMYGNTKDMRIIWNRDNPVHHYCGLVNTGHHFLKAFQRNEAEPWLQYVRRYCSLRDVVQIPTLCLRWNYKHLLENNLVHQVLENSLDVCRYNWGYIPRRHIFDENFNCIFNDGNFYWTQAQFYDENFSS